MRYSHRIEARSFRDYVPAKVPNRPLLMNQFEHAACVIGLGWRNRPRSLGPEIAGVSECTGYLNGVVATLIEEISGILRGLDRRSMVKALLLNHEAAARDRDRWRRTSQAVLALHSDQDVARAVIIEHDSRLGGCLTLSRILMEAAICECPSEGGRDAGERDLTQLMSLAQLVFRFGGDSDAVHWGAMESWIRVTPLGDIHMKRSFEDEVYGRFVRAGGAVQVERAVEDYPKLYARGEYAEGGLDNIEGRFHRAWEAEFGISMDGLLAFFQRVERMGIAENEAVLVLQKSRLVVLLAEAAGISSERASEVLSLLALKPRERWPLVPEGFRNRDWEPWRYRRRLSVLRRPLIQLDAAADPEIALAPGLMREAVAATMSNFYGGDVYQSDVRSPEMRSWVGHVNDRNGSRFAQAVEGRLKELGWRTKREKQVTELLALGRDDRFGDLKRFGDVDVLAWRDHSARVLAIECKDVQFQKTPGEVAEQLADFRGEMRADGKPDLLKRHLDRLEVLRANAHRLAKVLKIGASIEIEGHVVFRNPVPMRFAWERMADTVRLSLFRDLDRL